MGHRAAREALPEGAGDRQAHIMAGARQPAAWRSDQSLDRHRHVHQGIHGPADEDRHGRRRDTAQDHLRVGMSKILEARAATLAAPAHRPFRLRGYFERESVFSWIMMALPLLFLVTFLGYPLFYG